MSEKITHRLYDNPSILSFGGLFSKSAIPIVGIKGQFIKKEVKTLVILRN